MLLSVIVVITLQEIEAFGLSKNLLSRTTLSPRVNFIPLAQPGSSSCRVVKESSNPAPKQRWTTRVNPLPWLRNAVNQIPNVPGTNISFRALRIGLASVLVTIFARPTLAVAMGGGIGGSKGPVAPMLR